MSKRIMIAKFSPEVMIALLQSQGGVRCENLPEDAQVAYTALPGRTPFYLYGDLFNVVGLIIESQTFDEVQTGAQIPELILQFRHNFWKCKNCPYDQNSLERQTCEVCGRGRD